MNLVESKEQFLGSYNHDFPRLAKQSGFFFQLYRGKVNWSEIECLNLDDITENRNFELLEQNLLNVINCNVERDYDLKILDQNFVKLFKLAQLGIDYLSYCELYLDRCVVLLQEQLMSIQEEFKSLKNENEGKNLELKKPKNKKKINSYQCEKCDKEFISDVYLKFHDKRRHSNLSTPESKESLLKKLVNASQQTEIKKTLSVSIQTLSDESGAASQKNEDIHKIKKSHQKKIKQLEKNLNDVKARLQRAEKALQETREANSNPVPVSFPSSLHYHPLLQFMPPCFHQSRNIDEAIAEYQKSFPKNRSPVSDLVINVDHKISEGQKSPVSGNALLKEYNAGGAEKNSEAAKIGLICNKENMDPQNAVDVTKPLPPPRKTKKKFQNALCTEENLTVETFNQISNSAHSVANNVLFSKQSIDFNAVKGMSDPNIHSEYMENINGKKSNSNESLNISKKREEELTSLFKKVVGSSPKLQKLRKNLRRPLTNLYDSVSSTGKNLMNVEKKSQDAKCVLVDDLNNQLRELGIDPEWKGIPKKTMKQKLKDLTQRRKLLSKENPLYFSVRESAEKKILEKLKKKFFIRRTLPQKSCNQETEEDIHPKDEKLHFKSQESENIRNRNCAVLYDTDVDSWSKTSELEECQRKEASQLCSSHREQEVSEIDSQEEDDPKMGRKEFDAHLFQIKNGSMENRQEKFKKDVKLIETGEFSTNSDFEDNFSIRPDDRFFKSIHVKNDCEKLTVLTEVAQIH